MQNLRTEIRTVILIMINYYRLKRGIEKVVMELHPYFDKLNGHKSSKEVLTPEEYEQYMEALMSYQTVLVKRNRVGDNNRRST